MRTLKMETLAADAVSFTHFCHVFAEMRKGKPDVAAITEMASLEAVRESFESSLKSVGWMQDMSLIDVGGVQVIKYEYAFGTPKSSESLLSVYALMESDLEVVISIFERTVLACPNSTSYSVGLFDVCRSMVDAVSNYDWSSRVAR